MVRTRSTLATGGKLRAAKSEDFLSVHVKHRHLSRGHNHDHNHLGVSGNRRPTAVTDEVAWTRRERRLKAASETNLLADHNAPINVHRSNGHLQVALMNYSSYYPSIAQ